MQESEGQFSWSNNISSSWEWNEMLTNIFGIAMCADKLKRHATNTIEHWNRYQYYKGHERI